MTITVSVTEDVTTLSVTETETTLTIVPSTIELGVVNVAFTQASSADTISSEATGHITATNVQAALAEIGADPQFTSTLKNKLDNVEAQANKLTAGTNVNISEGAINADVLGAISAGQNISISEAGEISASAVSLTDVYTADDVDEHLDLDPTPNQGDVVIRTDENKTYIHNGGTAGTMADYTELATTGGVNSINGATGVVTFGKTNLDGYVANEFIDWTVEQASNIHSSNIDATTYYAGQNIAISEIEGLQYIQTQKSARINHSDSIGFTVLEESDANTLQYSLSVKHDYLLGQDNSGITFFSPYTGGSQASQLHNANITIEGLDQDTTFGSGGGGILINITNIEEDETEPLLLLTRATFQLAPSIVTMNAPNTFTVGGIPFVKREDIDETYTESTPTGTRTYTRKIKLNKGVYTETADIGTSDKGLATTEFVANAIALGGGGANIPAGSGHEKFVTQDEDGVFRNRDLDIQNQFSQVGDDVYLRIRNDQIDINAGNSTAINAGTGIILTAAENGSLTIAANTDGLPTQSEATDGYVLTSDGANADWVDLSIASLPVQTDNSGKFLTTNGTNASWAEVDLLPDQENNDGKFLTTFNGALSWGEVDAFPEQSEATNGKFLSSNGVSESWTLPDSTIPAQDTHTGKFLTTDGSQLSWSTINTAGTTGDISFSQSTITSSGDTVTVDDDLTTTGTLDAQQLDITGAGQPQITSASTFNIVAPEGLYINGNLLTGSDLGQGYQDLAKVEIGETQRTNVQANGSTTVTNTMQTKGVNTTYKYVDGNYFMEVQLQATQTTNNKVITATWVEKDTDQQTTVNVVDHSTKWIINFKSENGTSSYSPIGSLRIIFYEA